MTDSQSIIIHALVACRYLSRSMKLDEPDMQDTAGEAGTNL